MRAPTGTAGLCETTGAAALSTRGRLQRGSDERDHVELRLRRHGRLSHRSLRGAHGLVGCERVWQRINACVMVQAKAGGRRTRTMYGKIDVS